MQTPNKRSPGEFRDHFLKQLTQRGLPQTLAEFKQSVSPRSEAYREVVEMEVQYNELQREYLSGQLSKADESVESNRLTNQFVNLIDRLEADPGLLAERRLPRRKWMRWALPLLLLVLGLGAGYWFFGPDDGPLPTVGRVLYAIPSKMEVGVETRCLVRIAPETLSETQLSQGIADTVERKIESIRIGDIMTVDLVDEDEAFRVVAKSTREQPVEETETTEWQFDVTPLKPGRHELNLKISVRVVVDGADRVYKDVLVLDRIIDILSEPVPVDTSWTDGGLLRFAEDEAPVVDHIEQPGPDTDLKPEPEPEPGPPVIDKSEEPTKTIPDDIKTGETREPTTVPKPMRPGRFSFCREDFQPVPFLNTFAEGIERQNILYNSEPLSDCSGIFLRLCNALREHCPNSAFPDPDQARDSRAIARWYGEHDNLEIVTDTGVLSRKIQPGVILFYGHQGRTYENPTLEELTAGDGIEHVGVVLEVEKDRQGRVVRYTLFHGRSTGKPAGRTEHVSRPSKEDLPPFGNGDQQVVATAFLFTMPKNF